MGAEPNTLQQEEKIRVDEREGCRGPSSLCYQGKGASKKKKQNGKGENEGTSVPALGP